MNKLFIYYSETGSTDLVADIYKENGYEVYKLEPKHRLPKKFFWQVLIGGMLATFGHKASLKKITVDLNSYDEIVVGSPIWSSNFCCPINTLLKKIDLNKVSKFVLCSGSGEGIKAQAYLEEKKIEYLFLKEPKKYREELEKVIIERK